MAEENGGGSGMSEVIFITLLIIFLMVSWFLSGAAKDADVKSIFLSPPPPLGVGESIGLPGVADPYGEDGDYGREDSATITDEIGLVKRELEKIKGMPASPYAGKVEIGSHITPLSDGQGDYLTIRARDTNTTSIAITGWKLMSPVSSRSVTIGQGAEVYEAAGSSLAGTIFLSPGDDAVIASGRSPVGVSFKESRCTGYLDQFQDYYPQLSHDCPYADTEARSMGSVINDNKCIDYLESLSQCRIDPSPSSDLSDQCRQFVSSRMTYQGCVAAHRHESNFKARRWRIFLGYTGELWREKREVLVLLDESGRVVDSYSY